MKKTKKVVKKKVSKKKSLTIPGWYVSCEENHDDMSDRSCRGIAVNAVAQLCIFYSQEDALYFARRCEEESGQVAVIKELKITL